MQKNKDKRSTVKVVIPVVILSLLIAIIGFSIWNQRAIAMAELDKTNKQISADLTDMTTQLDTVKVNVNSSKDTINGISTIVVKQEDTIDTSFDNLSQDINTTINTFTVDTKELQNKITSAKDTLTEVINLVNEGQTADAQKKYDDLVAKLNSISSELDTLKSDNKTQYDDTIKKINDFSTKLDEYLSKTNDDNKELLKENFTKLSEQLTTSTDSLTTGVDDLSTQISDSTKTIVELIEKVDEEQSKDILDKFTEVNTKLDTINDDLTALNNTITENDTTLKNSITQFKVDLNNHIDEFASDLYDTLDTDFEAINQGITDAKAVLIGELDNISSEVDTANTDIQNLLNTLNEKKLEEVQLEFNKIQTELNDIQTHFDETIGDVNSLIVALSNQSKTEFNDTITKLVNVQNALTTTSIDNNTKLINKVNDLQTTYQGLISTLDNNISLQFTDLGNQVEQYHNLLSSKMDTVSQNITSAVDSNIANQNEIINSQFGSVNELISSNSTNFNTKFSTLSSAIDTNYNTLALSNYENDQELLELLKAYKNNLDVYHQQLDENFQCVAIGKQKLVTAIATQSAALERAGITVTNDMSFTELVDTLRALDKAIFYDEQGGCKFTEFTTQSAEEAPTCDKPGIYHKITYCTYCQTISKDEIVEVPALGHDYKETVVKPTCEHGGHTKHLCSRCGDSYITDELPIVEHKWKTGKVIKTATCLEPGTVSYTCEYCSRTKTEDIDPLGHDYKETVVNPTCTKAGYTIHKCDRCGDSYTDSETSPLGHTTVTLIQNNIAPSPNSKGSYDIVTKCTTCNNILSSEHHVVNATSMYELKHVHNDSCYVLVPEIHDDVCVHQCLPYAPYHKYYGMLRNWNQDWVVMIQAKGSSPHCQMNSNGYFHQYSNVSIFVNGQPDRIENPVIMSGGWLEDNDGYNYATGELDEKISTYATYSSPSTYAEDMNNPSNFSNRTVSHIESYTEMVSKIGCGHSDNDVEATFTLNRNTPEIGKATLSVVSTINASYVWSTGSTSASIDVTSNGTHTCTITYTNPDTNAVESTTLSYTVDDL